MNTKGILSIIVVLGLVWVVSFYASGFITGKLIKRNPVEAVASEVENEVLCTCHCRGLLYGYDSDLNPKTFNEKTCEGIETHNCLGEEGSERAESIYDSCTKKEENEKTQKAPESRGIFERIWDWWLR